MDKFHSKKLLLNDSFSGRHSDCDLLRRRLRQWQQVRTWARLIREAESLWHLDVKVLRRIGELELSQLLQEDPFSQRERVNRWLNSYSVATRFQGVESSAGVNAETALEEELF